MIAFLKFVLRLAGYLLLACTVVAFVADGSRSIAQSKLVVLPLGQFWSEFSPETLSLFEEVVQHNVSPFLWDPVLQTLLTWPIWAVLGPFGLILLWLGAHRRRKTNVFA